MSIIYTTPLGGNCPVQAEGLTDSGKPWYFRARDYVSLTVGKGTPSLHPLEDTLWGVDDDEEALKFESETYPGWASHDACEKWIIAALERFNAWEAVK